MEVSYSKLLARYQSRNGSWFAVNELNDGLDRGGGDSAYERGGDARRLA